MASSKLEYLKRYEGNASTSKKKKRVKKFSNFTILDDDAPSWEDVQSSREGHLDDPEDAPVVADMKDDSIIKWQPLSTADSFSDKNNQNTSSKMVEDLSPPRRTKKKSINQRHQDIGEASDLSPPRSKKKIKITDQELPRKRNIDTIPSTTMEKNKDMTTAISSKSDNPKSKSNDDIFKEWGRG